MNPLLDLLVRSVPILIGGGLVQFVIFMLKRRSELRVAEATAGKTDAESGSFVVTSAERSVAMADRLRDDATNRASALLLDLDLQLDRIRRLHGRLAETDDEISGLRTEIVGLRREVIRLRIMLEMSVVGDQTVGD